MKCCGTCKFASPRANHHKLSMKAFNCRHFAEGTFERIPCLDEFRECYVYESEGKDCPLYEAKEQSHE